ncbi:MAG: hypothetical protein QNJ14_14200 [Woeseiaceae bacterium]|nr:hypothetical protein [Woeseiaceae bacterium]
MRRSLLAVLFPLVALADPSPTTRYLFNEPATLFDIGMVRLEDLTDEFENRVGLHWTDGDEMKWFEAEVNSYYGPDEDTVVVGFSVANSDANEEQMAEGCENAINQMQIWLRKSLPRLFEHVGREMEDRPDSFNSDLTNMFEIRCYFSSARSSAEGRYWAYRRLSDDETTVGKWKMRN